MGGEFGVDRLTLKFYNWIGVFFFVFGYLFAKYSTEM